MFKKILFSYFLIYICILIILIWFEHKKQNYDNKEASLTKF